MIHRPLTDKRKKASSSRSLTSRGAYLSSVFLICLSTLMTLLEYRRQPTVMGLRSHLSDQLHHLMGWGSAFFRVVRDAQEYWSFSRATLDENQRLKQQLQALTQVHVQARQLAWENQELRQALKTFPKDEDIFCSARIQRISTPPRGSQLFLEAGSSRGLVKDQVVIHQGYLLGRITEVNDKTARILSIDDPLSRVPGVTERSHIPMVLAGSPEGNLKIIHTHHSGIFQVGEMVVSSGEGGLFPRGIPIGFIQKKVTGDYFVQPFAYETVSSYAQVLTYFSYQ